MPDAQPATTRVRHPLWFRRLTVRRVEALSPRVRRVILGGDDLEGFTTRSFDDHVNCSSLMPQGLCRTLSPEIPRSVFLRASHVRRRETSPHVASIRRASN
jgi:NADPH-dependent ferric siderophore reductase